MIRAALFAAMVGLILGHAAIKAGANDIHHQIEGEGL
jgi:hypothetical protein